MASDYAANPKPKTPAVAVALDILGWLTLFVSVAIALLTSLSGPEGPSPPWMAIASGAVSGLLFLAFAAIIRGLHRIELAVSETRRMAETVK